MVNSQARRGTEKNLAIRFTGSPTLLVWRPGYLQTGLGLPTPPE